MRRSRLVCSFIGVCALTVLVVGLWQAVKAQDEDKGESRANRMLANRRTAAKTADVDKGVSLEALLDKKDQSDWSTAKAATVEGYVVQIEREQDGDNHIVLAADAGETDTKKWVIVEVTPAWTHRKASLAVAALNKLHGTKVRVTGWLYYEPDVQSQDPRGTRWEIHPVTDITVLK